jgi:hypothetical protein
MTSRQRDLEQLRGLPLHQINLVDTLATSSGVGRPWADHSGIVAEAVRATKA